MEQIREFDEIRLKDGREASVVEVVGDQAWFVVEVGSSPADWETLDVYPDQIAEVIQRHT